MPKPRRLYNGGWVRTSMLSQAFAPVSGRCESCRRVTAGTVYMRLKDHRVLCPRCFEKAHPE